MKSRLRGLFNKSKRFIGVENDFDFVIFFLLYIFGIIHWWYFYNGGRINFLAYDWREQEIKYYAILKAAVQTLRIPYHVSFLRHGTDRFLAIPETLLSPQIILLRYISAGRFVAINGLLLYSIGFLGLIQLKKRLNLSQLPFTFMFLLFSFNGYITSNIASGHSMWNGYFLLPFFALYVFELMDESPPQSTPFKIAIVLFAILMQGAFQIFSLSVIFLILLVHFNRRIFKSMLLTLLITLPLSLIRILPTVTSLWNYNVEKGRIFIQGFGYPNLFMDFLNATTKIVDPNAPNYGTIYPEYNLYISLPGLLFLILFGVIYYVFQVWIRHPHFSGIAPALIIMTIFSFGRLYEPIYNLDLPFNPIRVASRFIVLPFVFLIINSSVCFQDWIDQRKLRISSKVLFWFWVIMLGICLGYHTTLWRIPAIEAPFPEFPIKNEFRIEVLPEDSLYIQTVNFSATITLITLLVVFGLLLKYWLTQRRSAGLQEGDGVHEPANPGEIEKGAGILR